MNNCLENCGGPILETAIGRSCPSLTSPGADSVRTRDGKAALLESHGPIRYIKRFTSVTVIARRGIYRARTPLGTRDFSISTTGSCGLSWDDPRTVLVDYYVFGLG
jgi:hypothetical protein